MKLKRHEIKSFQCDNCGHREKHIDMYNDEFCYDCIDIESGKLKKDLAKAREEEEITRLRV